MKSIIISILFLGLAACSKDGGGGNPLPELTPEQKARVAALSQETNGLRTGALDQGAKNFTQSIERTLQQVSFLNKSQPRKTSEKAKKYKEEMGHAVEMGYCTVNVEGIPNTDDMMKNDEDGLELPQKINAKFEITNEKGHECPIYTSLEFNLEGSGPVTEQLIDYKAQFDFKNVFRIRPEATNPLETDVLSFDQSLSGNIAFKASQSNINVNAKATGLMTIESREEFEGKVTLGNTITATVVASQAGLNMNLGFSSEYNFKDFRAVGLIQVNAVNNPKQPQTGDEDYQSVLATVKFFINGREVSEDEYMSTFEDSLVEGIKEKSKNKSFLPFN